jgi:hypothetical protein
MPEGIQRRILFDGWALIYAPAGPQALHLAAQLASLPAGVQVELALPAPAEGAGWLPDGIPQHCVPTSHTAWGRLTWVQQTLPRLADRIQADAVVIQGSASPLRGQQPVLAFPGGWSLGELEVETRGARSDSGLLPRLEAALGWGGLSRARAVYWPSDLPLPADKNLPWRPAPPLVHPLFQPAPEAQARSSPAPADLPETYIFYHGALDSASLESLAAAWSWAEGALGEYYPLILYGVGADMAAAILQQFQQAGLAGSLRLLPPLPPDALARLYQGCSALLHTGAASPWGCPIRHALACGRPVVAAAHPWTEALVGAAAYLAPLESPRQLGAALISVIVEPELAERLSAAAQARAIDWQPDRHWQVILEDLDSTRAVD